MTMHFKAHEADIDYMMDFGINLNSLGCVMYDLRLEDADITPIIKEHGFKPYVSPDPEKSHINGITKDHHVTIRYGFLPMVREKHVKQVLPHHPSVGKATFSGKLDFFPGFNGDEDYFVLIIRLNTYGEFASFILDCHNALGMLPNVQTFTPPEFHITLGYFTGDPTKMYRYNSRLIDAELGGIRCGRTMRP